MNNDPEVTTSADELDEDEIYSGQDDGDGYAREDEDDCCVDVFGEVAARSPGQRCEDERCVKDH